MDQIKTALAHLLKFRFWYLSALVAILSGVGWYLGKKEMDTVREKSTSDIKNKVSEIDRVINHSVPVGEADSVKTHPNEASIEGMKSEISEFVESSIEAWKIRRDKQAAIFVWPEILGSQEFISKFKAYEPPEKFKDIKYETSTERYAQLYRQQIPLTLPLICRNINTTWLYEKTDNAVKPGSSSSGSGNAGQDAQGQDAQGQDAQGQDAQGQDAQGQDAQGQDAQGQGGGSGDENPPADDTQMVGRTVVWDSKNQSLWNQKITQFIGSDGCETVYPTPYQLLALQQDLWLLEAMFKVIGEVNGTARGEFVPNDIAPIRRIQHVAFGREARAPLGLVYLGSAEGKTEAKPLAPCPPDFKLMGPFHNRYVDKDLQPISIDRIFNVLNGSGPPSTDFELLVAKRVPFRIALIMKEDAIPDFVLACGQSDFEFEILQTRINRLENTPEIKHNGSESNVEGTTRPAKSSLLKALKTPPPATRISNYIEVEFKGVVRIYNPVDEARLRAFVEQSPST